MASLKAFWPVREVRIFSQITSSSGENRSLMFGIVFVTYVHLLIRPCVNAAYAAWAYLCVGNSGQVFNCVHPFRHFLLHITKDWVPIAATRCRLPSPVIEMPVPWNTSLAVSTFSLMVLVGFA